MGYSLEVSSSVNNSLIVTCARGDMVIGFERVAFDRSLTIISSGIVDVYIYQEPVTGITRITFQSILSGHLSEVLRYLQKDTRTSQVGAGGASIWRIFDCSLPRIVSSEKPYTELKDIARVVGQVLQMAPASLPV